jgi:hypothetical protein
MASEREYSSSSQPGATAGPRRQRWPFVVAGVVLAAGLVAADLFFRPNPPAPRTLVISPKTTTFEESGATMQLTATITGGSAAMSEPRAAINWQSSDKGVATVGADGRVTAQGSGDATITAFAGGRVASARVSVQIPAAVIITPDELRLSWKEKTRISAIVVDALGRPLPAKPIEWRITDSHVASVHPDTAQRSSRPWDETSAIVMSGAPGSAVIAASWGGVSGAIPVTQGGSMPRGSETRRQGTARLTTGGEEVIWNIDKEKVHKYVRTQLDGILLCFAVPLKTDPTLKGRVEVVMMTHSNGAVSRCAIVEDTMQNPAVGNCICRRVERWRLPRPDEGTGKVSYVFIFTQELER